MNNSFKSAYDKYFERQRIYAEKTYGSLPIVPFTHDLDSRLIVSGPNEDEEICWRPVRVKSQIDWESIENQIGFKLLQEIKEYYSTYLFCSLEGNFGSAQLYFEPIVSEDTVTKIIIEQFNDAEYCINAKKHLLIGSATVDGDDSYWLLLDGENGKVICYENETKSYILLTYSIKGLIDRLEAFC